MPRAVRVCVFAAVFLGATPELRLQAQDEILVREGKSTESAAEMQDGAPKLPVLVVLLGGGARFRSIGLDVGDGEGGTEERTFDTGAYFVLGGHLLVRPMARRATRPSIQAIVFQIDGGAGVGLNVQPEGTGISLHTNIWELLGQFGYLYPIGRLQVGGLLGVGGDVLRIDLNSVLPSSTIVYVRVGPAVAYDIVPSFLCFRADFGLRVPFVLSQLEDAFGNDSSGIGLDGAVTLGGKLNSGFTYAFRFVWTYYRLHFSGPSMNVPAMGDGGGGKDNAISVQLLLGWSL
jgi:hypothetical protein